MKAISFKKAISIVFPKAENIKLHKGYYYCSGFFTVDGQCYYITTGDTRMNLGVMYRTAKDYKDYTGGINEWDFDSKLHSAGYRIGSVPQLTA